MANSTLPRPSAPITLAMAQEAVHQGDRQLAHDICTQLTADDPADEQAWLWRAGTSESLEEMIVALSQTLTLNPDNSTARHGLYKAMQGLLQRDASLIYLAETDDFYHLSTPANVAFAHPKDRAIPEPFPPPAPPPAQAAFRWLGLSLVGLIPAGLGTLVCAPIAMVAAAKLLRRRPDPSDRRRARIVFGSAAALWLLSLFFIELLILHL